MAQRLRQRLVARTEFVRQRHERARRQQQTEQDERAFRQRQMAELAERDRIEQLSNERRRQRIAEHNRIVLGLMEQRREQRAIDAAQCVQQARDADADAEEL